MLKGLQEAGYLFQGEDMNILTQKEIAQVSAGQGLRQFHRDEIQASNWPTLYDSGHNSQSSERLQWVLASRRQFEQFGHLSVR
ncbi:MAG: hypothetical protein Alis3KO_38150 [Aliiglaciecola sp.]